MIPVLPVVYSAGTSNSDSCFVWHDAGFIGTFDLRNQV